MSTGCCTFYGRGFTFFYTNVIFEQQNMAENLRKQGASIPGIRPGKRTELLVQKVRRITLMGAVFLGVVAILPWVVGLFMSLFPGTVGPPIQEAGRCSSPRPGC